MALPLNLESTLEKLLLSTRAVFAIENLADVSIITSRRTSQRTVLKSAMATGAIAVLGTSLLEPSSPEPGSQLFRSHNSQ